MKILIIMITMLMLSGCIFINNVDPCYSKIEDYNKQIESKTIIMKELGCYDSLPDNQVTITRCHELYGETQALKNELNKSGCWWEE